MDETGKDYPEPMVLISQREYDDLCILKAHLEEWKRVHESEPIAASIFSYGCMGHGSYKFRLYNETTFMSTISQELERLKDINRSLFHSKGELEKEIYKLKNPPKKWYQF